MPPSSSPTGRVRGSRTGRPIMLLLDHLGRRWALRILWELRGGALTFRALKTACGDPSPSVLNDRLAELRALRLVDAGDDGYQLSDDGRSLGTLLVPLDRWATRWGAGAR
jgi:DNA-binding HxlR family transcriptional regulator